MRVGEISTERLILRHSDQDRDGWKLLMMLEEEGDFRIFTGVEYSEKYRDDFLDYFEVTHGNRLIIPGLSEPPVRTLRATIPENESHIFR